jgi:hypothetical protein
MKNKDICKFCPFPDLMGCSGHHKTYYKKTSQDLKAEKTSVTDAINNYYYERRKTGTFRLSHQ